MGRKKKQKLEELPLFKPLLKATTKKKETAKNMLKTLVNLQSNNEDWRGLIAVPAGSAIDKTLNVFRINTDIPLEIPFFAMLHFISAWLLKKNVIINVKTQKIRPDIWTVILAESGSGKTFVTSVLKNTCKLDIDVGIGEIASSAKFIEQLSKHNNGLWLKDEFAQLLKAISNLSHMLEMKDYLLKLFDGERIERRTKKEEIVIEKPALTILGLTVKSTFLENISIEDMLDGQAQRFNYVIAEGDPKRTIEDFPIYDFERIVEGVEQAWEQLKNIKIHEEYTVNDKGIFTFETAFKLMIRSYKEIDKSFYRRIMWRGIKYALIYHVLLEKEGNEIDDVDMAWAARIVKLHLQDAKWLLQNHGISELEKVIRSAERLKQRLEEQGRTLTARDLIQNISSIKNVREAQVIMSFVS